MAAGFSSKSVRLMVVASSGAVFLAMLDIFVVALAMPSIGHDLGASDKALQWVLPAYALAYASLLLVGGRLGDRFGPRRLFLSGASAFLLASTLCAAAPTVSVLIAGRFAQGVGAAAMVPQVLAMFRRNLDDQDRARAMGLYGSAIGLGSIVGQILGGVLITLDPAGMGWRSAFLINLPAGVAAIWGVARHAPIDQLPEEQGRFDSAGALLLSGGVATLLLPPMLGHAVSWDIWLLGVGSVGVVLLASLRRHLRRPMPQTTKVIELASVTTRAVSRTLLLLLLLQATLAALTFTIPLTFQEALGHSALEVGLMLFVPSLLFVIVSAKSGRLPVPLRTRSGRVGLALTAAGLSMAAAAGTGLLAPSVLALLPGMVAIGIGYGVAFAPAVTEAVGSVEPRMAGTVSGLITTVMQAANVVGIALVGSVFLAAQSSQGMATLSAFSLSSTVLVPVLLLGTLVLRSGPVAVGVESSQEVLAG